MRIADRPLATLCALLAALAGLLVASGPADAAARLVIKGRGWGHGIGMSQYGAKGFADRGADYKRILGHYYAGTRVLPLGESPTIRVLLQSGRRAVFSGAVAAGSRRLNPASTYQATRSGARVALLSAKGRRIGTYDAPLRIAGPDGGAFRLHGLAANGVRDGRYRGALEIRPGGSGVLAINALDLESYIRGVVSAESPASWPAEALKAQAVAARSYALAANKGGAVFDHYPDTRSQVYRGFDHETAPANAAVEATAGQVLAYEGEVIPAFFFSTSGGRTEDVENVWYDAAPRPYLRSVRDPYDRISPRRRWEVRFTTEQMERRLRGLVKGSFRRIVVRRRGASPRVVAADVVGSEGRTRVSGATLKARLRLDDTWAYFRRISSRGGRSIAGRSILGAFLPLPRWEITGSVTPRPRGGRIVVERLTPRGWRTAVTGGADRAGRYRIFLTRPGTYRIRVGSVRGPAVRVR